MLCFLTAQKPTINMNDAVPCHVFVDAGFFVLWDAETCEAIYGKEWRQFCNVVMVPESFLSEYKQWEENTKHFQDKLATLFQQFS